MDRKATIEAIFTAMQTAQRAGTAKFHAALRCHGITPSQLELLFLVKHRTEGVTFKELAQQMQLTPGAVTQMVNKLVENCMVERREDPSDRRVSHVLITTEGRARLKKFWEQRMQFIRDVMQDLSDEELTLMLTIQKKLAARIGNESIINKGQDDGSTQK